MLGNVWEWTGDWYGLYTRVSPGAIPKALRKALNAFSEGGNCTMEAQRIRVSNRYYPPSQCSAGYCRGRDVRVKDCPIEGARSGSPGACLNGPPSCNADGNLERGVVPFRIFRFRGRDPDLSIAHRLRSKTGLDRQAHWGKEEGNIGQRGYWPTAISPDGGFVAISSDEFNDGT